MMALSELHMYIQARVLRKHAKRYFDVALPFKGFHQLLTSPVRRGGRRSVLSQPAHCRLRMSSFVSSRSLERSGSDLEAVRRHLILLGDRLPDHVILKYLHKYDEEEDNGSEFPSSSQYEDSESDQGSSRWSSLASGGHHCWSDAHQQELRPHSSSYVSHKGQSSDGASEGQGIYGRGLGVYQQSSGSEASASKYRAAERSNAERPEDARHSFKVLVSREDFKGLSCDSSSVYPAVLIVAEH